MKNDIKFDYSNLINKILDFYNLPEVQSISKLSRDTKINPYRLKSILINRGYFLTKEVFLITKALNIHDNDISKYFLNEEKE